MSGSHRSENNRVDSYRGSGGGQGAAGDGYRSDGGYGGDYVGSGHTGNTYAGGEYATGGHISGEHGSGRHGLPPSGSDEYLARSDEYPRRGTDSAPRGGYRGTRRSAGSGGYRAGSGAHRRVERERRAGRRLALLLTGAVAGAVVCVLAAFAILSGSGVRDGDTGQVVSGATQTAAGAPTERSGVPDACEMVRADLADRLAPDAQRTQADNYQSSDRQNQCVWGAYEGERKRQLTVEIRAVAPEGTQTGTEAARVTFARERADDESGKGLLAGQEVTDKTRLDGVGDEGYTVYSVDEGQGSAEAITNVRLSNVLVTVRYSGGDDGDPLAADAAMNGATDAAKSVLESLNKG
ncbi:hypothetical protein ACFQU9_45155 [Actinomadura namibiensis]|uniref:DUF3558 domain-containing protein n=1 Tax=Actinomadura namibiensis TaxID=182080 RepID=A0A7W3LUB8_ACTNM|nr:hypothetical protein [Actinomadura namibiensis]MBA8954439.1 hypothetical protein [Actinomadura namibiensis]